MATSRETRRALVLGASSGIGRATALRLARDGAHVTAIARGRDRLERLAADAPEIATIPGDVTDGPFVERVMREVRPDAVVLTAGVNPRSAPLVEHTWESFSEAWQTDTRAAFHLVRAALAQPLEPGATIAIVTSGAAIRGSHLSGGYAGAKRMSWWLASYAQQQADARGLGLRFVSIVPEQLVVGTEIAEHAAVAYGAWLRITPEQHLARWESPLDCDGVAAAIVRAIEEEAWNGARAMGVTGRGIEPIA